MRGLLRLILLMVALLFGGILLIRLVYNVSWRESLEVMDQFVEDLLS